MTLKELKRKTLVLIEEYNANSNSLTDDIDIEAKFNDVANQNMYEICRIKKLPKYAEMEVKKGDIITFEDIEMQSRLLPQSLHLIHVKCLFFA